MKYPVNRLKPGQTIRARSREWGIVVMTIQRIHWKESEVILCNAAGIEETLNIFDWVELLEERNDI